MSVVFVVVYKVPKLIAPPNTFPTFFYLSITGTSVRVEERKKLRSSNLLRQIPMFGQMDTLQFTTVVDAMVYMEFQHDALVMLQGKRADKFCVLTKGVVEIYVKQNEEDDMTIPVGQESAPWYFGERALVPGDVRPTRTATIRTKGPCRMLALTYDAFLQLKKDGVIRGNELEQQMLQREAHWKEINAQKRQNEDTVPRPQGMSVVEIENNANGIDIDAMNIEKEKESSIMGDAVDADFAGTFLILYFVQYLTATKYVWWNH